MVLGWVSMRWAASQRAFTVTLLACVFAILGLYTLLEPHSLPGNRFRVLPAFDPSFGINLDCDSEFDWVSGPVVQGELVKLDLQPLQGSEPALNQEHIKCQAQPLGNHTITPDGLLIVNPNGPHPIFQLIRDAEAAWEAKHTQASKTLDEAVSEYKRRYRRAPPLGFDKWCVGYDRLMCHAWRCGGDRYLGGTMSSNMMSSYPMNTTRYSMTSNPFGASIQPSWRSRRKNSREARAS